MTAITLRSQSYNITRTASGASGAATISLAANTYGTNGVFVGQKVSGTGIGPDATVSSINTTTSVVTLSVNNTATINAGTIITFSENTKSTPLTNAEIDGNFTELNERLNTKAPSDRAVLTNVTINSGSATLTSLTVGAITISGGGDGLAASAITSGTLAIARGGTNSSATPTAGGIAYGTGTAYAFIAAGTSGHILVSGGTSAPTWLGTVPIARGGTNSSATPTAGGIAYGTGTAYAFISAGSAGQVLVSNGTSAPSWTTINTNISISNDTSTNTSTFYPTLVSNQTSGSASALVVSSTNLYFNPSTGILSAQQFSAFSDVNLKDNVVTVSTALDTVDKLRGVAFNWKNNQQKSYGVIAQELESILPELVSGTDTKSVNYAGLTAFLINAVKELHARVQVLERA